MEKTIYEYYITNDWKFESEPKRIKKVHTLKETPKRYGDDRAMNSPLRVRVGYIPKDKIGKVITEKTGGLYFYELCGCYLTEENDELAREILFSYINELIEKREKEIAYYKKCME